MGDDASATARHWQDRYSSTAATEVSWFEETPATSLELIDAVAPRAPRSVVDVGGGASRLVDHLVARGDEVAVVDVSAAAIDTARNRLARTGTDPGAVEWIDADIRTWAPPRRWDVWHDRALLHFLTEAGDREAYVAALRRALAPGGGVVIGVFAEDGPTHCSGLRVHRYSVADLRGLIDGIEVVAERRTTHLTPQGATQRFRWLAGRLPAGTDGGAPA